MCYDVPIMPSKLRVKNAVNLLERICRLIQGDNAKLSFLDFRDIDRSIAQLARRVDKILSAPRMNADQVSAARRRAAMALWDGLSPEQRSERQKKAFSRRARSVSESREQADPTVDDTTATVITGDSTTLN